MKQLILGITLLFASMTANAYYIGNTYATLVSCNYEYNSDYMASGYVGLYRTANGNLYKVWFGSNYCSY